MKCSREALERSVDDLVELLKQKNKYIKELEETVEELESSWTERDGGGFTNQEIIDDYDNLY